MDIHDRHLGLPTLVGRLKKVITNVVKEKPWKKLQGWKGMVLSKVGQEVTIKAVTQSLPTYAMSVFKFSSSFCDEMRSLIRNFGGVKSRNKGRFIGLRERSYANLKVKGACFRDMKLFN